MQKCDFLLKFGLKINIAEEKDSVLLLIQFGQWLEKQQITKWFNTSF